MAFVFTVEDGTGLEDANAYISVAFADDYHEGRGHTDWAAALTADKQAAIVRATDYVDERFGRRFRGYRRSESQGLEWPRISAFDNDDYLFNGIDNLPRQLEKAVAEYALITLRQGELLPNPPLPTGDEAVADGSATATESNSGLVTRNRERVGPIETETQYANMASFGAQQSGGRAPTGFLNSSYFIPEYPRADQWIHELLRNPHLAQVRRG